MKQKFLLTSILILILNYFSMAQNEDFKDFKKTPSGLKYKILEHGKGKKPEKGSIVEVHYKGMFLDGKEFDNSYKRGAPFKFVLGQGQVIKGWDEGIALLHEGDKAILIIPPQLVYGNRQVGPIPPNSTLKFEVELIKVKDPVKVEPFDVKGKDTVTTEDGLKYIVVKSNPQGKQPKKGDKVKVHYTGYFEDGKIFDSSVKRDSPFEFTVGVGQVIKGWDEGLMLMHEGEKYRFIIPYQLGYGERGYPGAIPPKATLIFDVELLKVE